MEWTRDMASEFAFLRQTSCAPFTPAFDVFFIFENPRKQAITDLSSPNLICNTNFVQPVSQAVIKVTAGDEVTAQFHRTAAGYLGPDPADPIDPTNKGEWDPNPNNYFPLCLISACRFRACYRISVREMFFDHTPGLKLLNTAHPVPPSRRRLNRTSLVRNLPSSQLPPLNRTLVNNHLTPQASTGSKSGRTASTPRRTNGAPTSSSSTRATPRSPSRSASAAATICSGSSISVGPSFVP